jgi:hypothetical protein
MSPRLYLESNLLGRLLTFESEAVRACDVLSPTNFSDPFCRQIFEIIFSKAGKFPVDILTVTLEYHRIHGKMKAYQITCLTDNQAGWYIDIWQPCLELLEMDMREKTTALFLLKERKYSKAQNLDAAAAMKQCMDHLASHTNDIFEAIESVYGYAKAHLPDDVADIEAIVTSIPKKVAKIKEQSRTTLLIDTLTELCHVNSNKATLNLLKDAFLTTLQSKEIPQYILQASDLIEKNLYASR